MNSIRRKLKPCKACGDPKYIFSHGNCLECSTMLKISQKRLIQQLGLKQTERETTAKPFKVKKAIKRVGDKQLKRLAEYRKVRDEHFKEFPTCQYPGCGSNKIQLHHSKGRCGDYLTNKEFFRSLCDEHHKFCELNPLEAKKLKLSFDRL